MVSTISASTIFQPGETHHKVGIVLAWEPWFFTSTFSVVGVGDLRGEGQGNIETKAGCRVGMAAKPIASMLMKQRYRYSPKDPASPATVT